MEILERIKKRRLELKISTTKMGKFLNMTHQNYQSIETGRTRMSLEVFLQICKELKISPMELLNSNTNENYIMLTNDEIETLKKTERIINKIITERIDTRTINISNTNNSQIIISSNIKNNTSN